MSIAALIKGDRRDDLTGKDILFVGQAASRAASGGDDADMMGLFSALGATITYRQDSATVTGDATGKDLVFVSASVGSTAVGAKFKTVVEPVFLNENFIWDDMGITDGTGLRATSIPGTRMLNAPNAWTQYLSGVWDHDGGTSRSVGTEPLADFGPGIVTLAEDEFIAGEISGWYGEKGVTGDAAFILPGRRAGWAAPQFSTTATQQSADNRHLILTMCQWCMAVPMVGQVNNWVGN